MSDEQAYEEGYRWLYKILRDAGYDPNRENPEAFAKRTRIAEEENERLRAWVTTGVEENERLRGLIEQQAGQLEEEQSQTGWLREQVIESKEENERLRATIENALDENTATAVLKLRVEELKARIDAALAYIHGKREAYTNPSKALTLEKVLPELVAVEKDLKGEK